MTNYALDLQPELQVNYCRLVSVSTEPRIGTSELRSAVGAHWPFLSDARRTLLNELNMADTSEKRFGPVYVPYTFVLDADRTIYKAYNGWWYVGRPTVEELRMDLRALLSRRPDWAYDPDWQAKMRT